MDNAEFGKIATRYRGELLNSVVPFWLEHSLDRRSGGLLTCIRDDGTVVSEEKYMWSQLRGIWTFSALYNRIERRQEWLDAAQNIFEFVVKHGRDRSGRWVYSVGADGQATRGATSIFTDGFAILGLTELARATGGDEPAQLALETYQRVAKVLEKPDRCLVDPYPPLENLKAHSVAMSFALAFYELGEHLGEQEILDAGLVQAKDVMDAFRRPDDKVLLEFVDADNRFVDSPRGRSIVPGHAIESMWFMLRIFEAEKDQKRIAEAIETIKWHLDLGWDDEWGGLLLAVDSAGGTPWWANSTLKLWWPHCEALYALLLAYDFTGEDWCTEWFERIDRYSFQNFPVPEHGEWRQKLDRHGREFTGTVALPVKDPFHLPRALMYCIPLLESLAQHGPRGSMTERLRN